MVDEELSLGRRPHEFDYEICEFTDEEKNKKESDVELELDGEAVNRRLKAQFKIGNLLLANPEADLLLM